MNTIISQHGEPEEVKDDIATVTTDEAETWNTESDTDILWNPEAEFSSPKLEESNQKIAQLIASLLIVSAIKEWTNKEEDYSDNRIKVISFDSSTEKFAQAA